MIDIRRGEVFLPVFLLTALVSLPGETRWYRSNAAGMALEGAYSGLALRGKYALSITAVSPDAVPEILREYYSPGFQAELRTLYENGLVSRRQWLFRDAGGLTRLAASFNAVRDTDSPEGQPAAPASGEAPAAPGADVSEPAETFAEIPAEIPAESAPELSGSAGEAETSAETPETSPDGDGEAEPEAPDRSGFIELYNAEGLIIEDHRLDSRGKDQIVAYTYNGSRLIRADTRIKTPQTEEAGEISEDYCTDYYRYTRSYSLRSVERVFHPAAARVPEDERVRLSFPHMILGAARNTDFVRPGSAFGSDFFEDVLLDSVSRVLYTTDDRGRVLTETRRDEEGNVTGELRNTWSGDRLIRVEWTSGEDERVTEYEYDDEGDRILERNINQGRLERTIRREGDREVEELYMNGRVILRAIWEGGRKISEVRVSPQAGGKAGDRADDTAAGEAGNNTGGEANGKADDKAGGKADDTEGAVD